MQVLTRIVPNIVISCYTVRYMKRRVSSEKQTGLRTAIYSFMTLSVTVIVSLLMLIVLGYQFNEKDGKLEQGGLLQFQTQPSGAKVILDGRELLSTTTTKSTVEAGKHSVVYKRLNYRDWTKEVNIEPGQIGWLDYARLIPNNTVAETTNHNFSGVAGAVPSDTRKYILVQEFADDPLFTVVDISSDVPRFSTLALPELVFTKPDTEKFPDAPEQTFSISSWSQNDDRVLLRHTYDNGRVEWIVMDRKTPSKSININMAYAISPDRIDFASKNGKLLFVQTGDIVRRINLDEETLSRPLATAVANYDIYDEKTIIFTTLPTEESTREVKYAAIDIESPVRLGVYPADDQPLFASMATYFNARYVAVLHGKSLVVKKGTLPTATNKGTMKTYSSLKIAVGATSLASNTKGRFVYVTYDDGFGTYDVEFKKFNKTRWAKTPNTIQKLHALDGYMFWSDYGGELWFYDFDGANQQKIIETTEGIGSSLTPNGKYVYTFVRGDEAVSLLRVRLILP